MQDTPIIHLNECRYVCGERTTCLRILAYSCQYSFICDKCDKNDQILVFKQLVQELQNIYVKISYDSKSKYNFYFKYVDVFFIHFTQE